MALRASRDFDGSQNKIAIRQRWDRPVLDAAMAVHGHVLSYLGLPGPAAQDLLEWRDILGVRTGVERLRRGSVAREEDRERHRRLLRTVMINDISDGFQPLRGEIEDIILDTTDVDGASPLLNDGQPLHRMRFLYDLINLDFFGGVGYRDKRGISKRVRALKKLFERQQGTSFVLLLTFSVRDGLDDELTQYLTETRDRADGELRRIVEWYARCGTGDKDHKLKALVPLFLQRQAEDNMFRCHTYPPIAYDGNGGTRMVHFAFALNHTSGNLRAFSAQSDSDLLKLPLVTVHDGRFRAASKHPCAWDRESCAKVLGFLPHDLRQAILTTLPGPVGRPA